MGKLYWQLTHCFFPTCCRSPGFRSFRINFCLLTIPGWLSSSNVVKKLQRDWNNVADYPEDNAGWNPAKIWWDLLWSDITNCSSESFKQALDTFLKTIPDEPQTPGYTCMRRAESNSLIHMTPLTTARHPSISEELDNMPQARGGHPWSPRDWTRKPSTSIDK